MNLFLLRIGNVETHKDQIYDSNFSTQFSPRFQIDSSDVRHVSMYGTKHNIQS